MLFDQYFGAEFSACGKYRYKLWRIWDEKLPEAMCIGLNPSKANTNRNDPTITILIKMLKKLGYGGFYMVNLFAYISSKPADLLTVTDPLGDNDVKLEEAQSLCDFVIICWGRFKQATSRIKDVLPRYPNALCFGKTLSGDPYHPLALMYSGMSNDPKLYKYNDSL